MRELLSLEQLSKLPGLGGKGPCVYFLWRGEELLYIGATSSRGERLRRHWSDTRYQSAQSGKSIPFDRETFLDCSGEEMWDLEHAYQTKYDAPYNIYGYQRRKSNVER